MVRTGRTRSVGCREQKFPKSLLHHPELVLHLCNPVSKRFSLPGPERLLHPHPTTSEDFPFSGPRPEPLDCKTRIAKLRMCRGGEGSNSRTVCPKYVCVCSFLTDQGQFTASKTQARLCASNGRKTNWNGKNPRWTDDSFGEHGFEHRTR